MSDSSGTSPSDHLPSCRSSEDMGNRIERMKTPDRNTEGERSWWRSCNTRILGGLEVGGGRTCFGFALVEGGVGRTGLELVGARITGAASCTKCMRLWATRCRDLLGAVDDG
jgi:hypothetical protein